MHGSYLLQSNRNGSFYCYGYFPSMWYGWCWALSRDYHHPAFNHSFTEDIIAVLPHLPSIIRVTFYSAACVLQRLWLLCNQDRAESFSISCEIVYFLVSYNITFGNIVIDDYLLTDLIGYYNSVTHCVTSIVRLEGIRAFYLSLGTTLMMNVPYGCIMVAANESARKILNPSGEFSYSSSMLSGLLISNVFIVW